MAENLFLLKRRIRTARNINQIAKAMEMVSASKIKRAQIIVEKNREYSDRITNLTENLLAKTDIDTFNHPFLTATDSKNKLLIAFSPDKGLCGSLNTNLYKALLDRDMKDTKVVVVGRKIEMFSAKMEYELLATFPMGTSLPKYSVVMELIKLIEDEFSTGKVGTVEILYANFGSIFQQTVTTTQLLPLAKPETTEQALPFIVEPSVEDVLSALLPSYVEVKLYDFLMNAYTSEQAARMVAMQNAKNNAKDVAEFLTLTYNKNRQEKITNEILDLANNQ